MKYLSLSIYIECLNVKVDGFIKSRKLPLPFIPSHQGRGNWTFYEAVKVNFREILLR